MRNRTLAVGGAVAAAVVLIAYTAFQAGLQRGRSDAGGAAGTSSGALTASKASMPVNAGMPTKTGVPLKTGMPLKAGDTDPASGRRVLYWHDPMVPGARFDKPGKSPFMDMELVPVYDDGAPDAGGIAVSPRLQQSLGVRTARAVAGSLSHAISVVGNVAYNERDVVAIQARSNGFVEKLFVRAPLDPVRKGQPLAELYVPEWVAAQEEYLSAKRFRSDVDALALGGLADAAAQRMRLAGMTDEQIRLVDQRDAAQARFTITSPIDGVVGELSAREGMTVAAGAPLFRLNGIRTVWVNAEVPEGAVADIRPGISVQARTPAAPGSLFKGRVSAILPEVNPATRTLKARIELANPNGVLVPGMFATIDFAPSAARDAVLVPSEAVIRTGKRTVVIVAREQGRFAPVDVEAGMESHGQTEIRKGVRDGDSVVVSGQFLIDSEASLKAATARMDDAPADAAPAGGEAAGGGHADHAMDGGTAHDMIDRGTAHDMIDGGTAHDMIDGGTAHDMIAGGTAHDMMDGGTARDMVHSEQHAAHVHPAAPRPE